MDKTNITDTRHMNFTASWGLDDPIHRDIHDESNIINIFVYHKVYTSMTELSLKYLRTRNMHLKECLKAIHYNWNMICWTF